MIAELAERLYAPLENLLPALTTFGLHALLIYVLAHNWSDARMSLHKPVQAPNIVNARLVELSQVAAKKEQPAKAAPRPQPEPKPEPKPAPRPEPKPEPQPAPRAESKPEPEPKTQSDPPREEQESSEPALTAEELAASAREDIARMLEAEEQAREAATAEEMAASYAALIRRTVVNYWNRPPSARNDMEALLRVQLVPTGEVVSVTVVKSSGNAAFDRSAVNAVERAGRFPELQNLPSRQFEENFRQFSLLFRPEDLRY